MQHRVKFDFDITFSNGGSLHGEGFRLDIKGDDISDDELSRHIVRDLRLLMVASVSVSNKSTLREAHKRRCEIPGAN
ncbi:MAG: cyclase [Proteobacteria bacterium]|nr:cyclase [Pseudomonadota bacterium]